MIDITKIYLIVIYFCCRLVATSPHTTTGIGRSITLSARSTRKRSASWTISSPWARNQAPCWISWTLARCCTDWNGKVWYDVVIRSVHECELFIQFYVRWWSSTGGKNWRIGGNILTETFMTETFICQFLWPVGLGATSMDILIESCRQFYLILAKFGMEFFHGRFLRD